MSATVSADTDRGLGIRLWAGCALLIGLAFIQAPGYLIADTKFDLVENPLGFLERAFHLWDPFGAFGQLQNQAYGYLWPMGPFFVLGDLLDLSGWVTQRLWLATVLCVAFVGVARLARELGVRSDLACLVAAVAYALSPRMLSTLGPISIEAWPGALAPWVLLPLVVGSRRGSARRAAAGSALAIAMVGGVNAAATAAVLPLGAIWVLTRTSGARKRALLLWWPIFTFLGTCWWLVPLFVMGAYSPPFLDFIEAASITTFPTTVFDALRGTSAWTPYIDPGLQGGHLLLREGYLALNGGLLLALGIAGIASRRNPHRQFLLLSLLAGLLLVTMGHEGVVQGWFAPSLNGLLDGALAALRNVHKFDPIIRLPMALGIAWLLQPGGDRAVLPLEVGRRKLRVPARTVVAALAMVGLAGSTLPATTGSLAPARPVYETPPYWKSAADWLADHADGSVALLAPGSAFANYRWGSPDDEPLQYLARTPWAVRNVIPLAPPGNIRMLDAIEQRFAEGRASSGLARFLRRAGVGHIVVRNDLAASDDIPDPALVRSVLRQSPGVSLAAEFGPELGGEVRVEDAADRTIRNGGWEIRRRAIEVYEVAGRPDDAVSASRLPVVVGGPEDLLDLEDAGILTGAPTVLAVDVGGQERPAANTDLILTDGLVERERFFGRIHDGAGPAFTPGDVIRSGNPTTDYTLRDQEDWQTTVRLRGAAAIRSSSSTADPNAPGGSRPGELSYAAVDGDADTWWASNPAEAEVPWWQVDLDRTRVLDAVTVTLGPDGMSPARIQVRTDAGASEPTEVVAGQPRTIKVPRGQTRMVRVESLVRTPHQLSLREVAWDRADVRRELVLPEVPAAWGTPSHILLRARSDARSGCVTIESRVACRPGRAVPPEEPGGFVRVVELPQSQTYQVELTARSVAGPALLEYLQEGMLLNVAASSTAVPDPRASPLAAVDGDDGTSWMAKPTDTQPQLNLRWVGRHVIKGLELRVPDDAAVRRPTRVRLTSPDGTRESRLDSRGRARFAPLRTDRLDIEVLDSEDGVSLPSEGEWEQLPVGVSELRLDGLPYSAIPPSTRVVEHPCGSGPVVSVNGRARRTSLVASMRELYDLVPVSAVTCGEPSELVLTRGENVIEALGNSVVAPHALAFTATAATPTAASDVVLGRGEVTRKSPVASVIRPAPGARAVAVAHNANEGWKGVQGGRELDSIAIDGWKQGWLPDGSAHPIRAEFTPDVTYRAGLLAGIVLLMVLVASTLFGRWRRGTDDPPVAAAQLPPLVMVALTLAACGLLGAGPGLLAGAVGCAVSWMVRVRSRDEAGWLAGIGLVIAGLGYYVRPWGSPDGWAGSWAWPHYLVLFSLGVAVGLAAARPPRPPMRIAGRSTNR
ncbi:alpha-(1-_3)-arabinofuranosyltransferase domain-containing protein [Nocardioides massiliensis]|uniref:Arabinofuranan 3-O-arabinosyltransferase n=1 Tax=Nocardioides massiliensis TaxID=1325935 RepID=A0ABT9NSS2_9ACTN|nr:alpha-(1->3)-arabinofuranosyltransferase family protein [Nocardioides massiliensis]MDP9823453.1 arabinofuranan 3-O-arabinosyltransferase [Nocardioides massiliensis]